MYLDYILKYKKVFILIIIYSISSFAEKVLIYDDERGIIEVDKKDVGKKLAPLPPPPMVEKVETTMVVKKGKIVQTGITSTKSADLHTNRIKDPSSVYFQSALQYYKSGNYDDAMKNFNFADSIDPQPGYKLWIGKTFRQLGNPDQMLAAMDAIITRAPQSDVADDALFEIAFYYQTANNYDSAQITYAQLAEQYPFGKSFLSNEDFLAMSRSQRKAMESEMTLMLRVLGFIGPELGPLYRDFQNQYDLPRTAKATPQTVELIKTKYQEYLTKGARQVKKQAHIGRLIKTGSIIAGAFCLLIFINTITLVSIGRKKAKVETAQQILSELKVDVL